MLNVETRLTRFGRLIPSSDLVTSILKALMTSFTRARLGYAFIELRVPDASFAPRSSSCLLSCSYPDQRVSVALPTPRPLPPSHALCARVESQNSLTRSRPWQ